MPRLEPLALAAVLVLTAGCSTVVHGPFQTVRLESDPPGATATVSAILSERGPPFLDPAKQTVTTPATVRLHRDNTYRIELAKPGYKITSTKVMSSYDWLWVPVPCGPCEVAGDLPKFDLKGKALPLRLLEAAFYEYPRGFFRAWGYGLRLFNPEAWLGTSFKLKPPGGGVLAGWHALGEPHVTAKLEPLS